jgi:hypothetical protein
MIRDTPNMGYRFKTTYLLLKWSVAGSPCGPIVDLIRKGRYLRFPDDCGSISAIYHAYFNASKCILEYCMLCFTGFTELSEIRVASGEIGISGN